MYAHEDRVISDLEKQLKFARTDARKLRALLVEIVGCTMLPHELNKLVYAAIAQES